MFSTGLGKSLSLAGNNGLGWKLGFGVGLGVGKPSSPGILKSGNGFSSGKSLPGNSSSGKSDGGKGFSFGIYLRPFIGNSSDGLMLSSASGISGSSGNSGNSFPTLAKSSFDKSGGGGGISKSSSRPKSISLSLSLFKNFKNPKYSTPALKLKTYLIKLLLSLQNSKVANIYISEVLQNHLYDSVNTAKNEIFIFFRGFYIFNAGF